MPSLAHHINRRLLRPLGVQLLRTSQVGQNLALHYGRSFAQEQEILQELLGKLAISQGFYVDIGASDGTTWSNTVELARQGWQGVCFEYALSNVAAMARAYESLETVQVCHGRVTPHNIVALLQGYSVPNDFDVLSLDIDSYDYFVLEAILSAYRPAVIVAEINEKLPPPLEFTYLYDDAVQYDGSHCFGMSICQAETLWTRHGYGLTHLEYNNIFLIDRQRFDLPCLSATDAYEIGYRTRPDREAKFPWNAPLEPAQTLPPAEAAAFFNALFARNTGHYQLTYPG